MTLRKTAKVSSQPVTISLQGVAHVAQLARLQLDAAELQRYQPQLARILDYVSKLQQLDTAGVTITAQVTGLTNMMREDELQGCPPETRERLLAAAPERSGDFIQTTGVFA